MLYATFVYAKCTRAERRALWFELEHLAGTINRPWLVGGDCNVIASATKYAGRASKDSGAISDFMQTLTNYRLHELPFTGNLYTWSRIRAGARVWKRLDRVLVN